MKIDLSPQCVEAIERLQNGRDEYRVLVEDTCDYIIECTDTVDEDCRPAAAITLLRSLRSLGKVIAQLGEGGAQ